MLSQIIVIESDIRVREALEAEFEGLFTGMFFASLLDAIKALEEGSVTPLPQAAIVQMVNNSNDELCRLMDFLSPFQNVSVFVTLNYDGDFQILQSHIRSYTPYIFFRPFEIDKLVNSLKTLNL
ncbi:MAG: hypothetical protein ABH878_08090 [bacterium]